MKSVRNEEHFNAFLQCVCQEQQSYGVAEPLHKRKHCAPRRFEVGEAEPKFLNTPKNEYRRIYFEVVDHIFHAVSDWFDQQGYQTY